MVFVLSSDGRPLDPCHPARARKLLKAGRAVVWRTYPFTIRLADRTYAESVVHSHRLKIDPGSKTTGIAIVQEATERVVFASELTHRVLTTLTWAKRLERLCPLSAIGVELVRFDTQLMQDAEVAGVAYQQGEVAGYEVRAYVLEKWGRTCAYCGATSVPFQVEHLVPKARGGSNRVSNLTLACEPCNLRKGNQTAAEFGYPHLMSQAKQPLKDAAAVNSVRWALWQELAAFGLPLEAGTGGRTKWNRTRLGLSKSHWADAACHPEGTRRVYVRPPPSPTRQRAADRGQGPRNKADVRDKCQWLPSASPAAPEALLWVSDWRSGESGGAEWQVRRHARWADCGAEPAEFQAEWI